MPYATTIRRPFHAYDFATAAACLDAVVAKMSGDTHATVFAGDHRFTALVTLLDEKMTIVHKGHDGEGGRSRYQYTAMTPAGRLRLILECRG